MTTNNGPGRSSRLPASSLLRSIGVSLLLLALPVHGCGVTDQQYINDPSYSGDGTQCPVGSSGAGYINRSNYNDQDLSQVYKNCAGGCNYYRYNNLNCNAYILQLVSGQASATGTADVHNSWRCDYYTALPTPAFAASCSTTAPVSIYGMYRETVNSCFSSSSASASVFCSSVIGSQPPPVIVYAATTTFSPLTTTTTSGSDIITVTETYSASATVYASSTETVTVTDTTTTVNVKFTTNVLLTTISTGLIKTSTVTKIVTPTATATRTMCNRVPRAAPAEAESGFIKRVSPGPMTARSPILRGGELIDRLFVRDIVPPPACLAESVPTSIVSSACSCLFTATISTSDTLSVTLPTQTIESTVSTTITTSADITLTSYLTSTVLVSASSLTTLTQTNIVTSTRSSYITKITTSTAFASYTKTITGLTTKTVTTTIPATPITTFALYARPIGSTSTSKKYRLFSRKLGTASKSNPNSRALQYYRADAPPITDPTQSGVNATIIDGALYVLSQADNPLVYGVSVKLDQGPDKGRIILGYQEAQNTGLKGCSIKKSTGSLTCQLPNGQPANWQELGWPGATDGRLLLGQIPTGGGGQYKPVMELAVAGFGTMTLGCS